MNNTQNSFEFLTHLQQINLIEYGYYMGSSEIEGVQKSLFLTKGNYWVEVFYKEDEETINYMDLCPEHRLSLYFEGCDILDGF